MKRINPGRILRKLACRLAFPRRHECVLCGHTLYQFLPYRKGAAFSPPLMQEIGCVGSDLDQYECPWCGCNDRERHLFLYMKATRLLSNMSEMSVLHFAPERHLSRCISAARPRRYVKCDLNLSNPGVIRMNILNISFKDGTFDLLVANHVLEHVANDLQALSEIWRVLKPGGYAILQTPYSSKLRDTWSDAGVDSDAARLHAYGQEDHVRLYGLDIFQRFESTGLKSCVKHHFEILPGTNGARFGINEREPFFLFQRQP